MKLAIMQPYLFPYIGYFQLLAAADKFVVFDDVNFIKKGWINKNNILIGGQVSAFTVPLQNASQNRLIKDIEIAADGEKWREKFLQSLRQNYKKAEFFGETYNLVESVLDCGETFISKMILQSLRLFKEKLNLNVAIIESSEIYDNRELKGQFRILDICRRENARHYINPIGGTELYDRELFEKNDVKLSFLQPTPFSYRQFVSEFAPHLSIIDVLMFNGFAVTKNLLAHYVLS